MTMFWIQVMLVNIVWMLHILLSVQIVQNVQRFLELVRKLGLYVVCADIMSRVRVYGVRVRRFNRVSDQMCQCQNHVSKRFSISEGDSGRPT